MEKFKLNYDDYMEEAIFSKKADSECQKQISDLYHMLDEYNRIVGNEDVKNISIGFSPVFGFYTYSNVDNNNYQLMKLGKDKYTAFVKIVINCIEFENAVRAENFNTDQYRNHFERIYTDMDYSKCVFYANYMMKKFKAFYDGNDSENVMKHYNSEKKENTEFDDRPFTVSYVGNVPDDIIAYFKNYLFNTTGREWNYNGFDFVPVKKENVKERVRV